MKSKTFFQIGDSRVERVFSPRNGEFVDATIESFIYQVFDRKSWSVRWRIDASYSQSSGIAYS